MDFAETVKVLHFLGLSEYEARVYVSLVTEGASEARKLSVKCGVPRTKVYTTLKKLIERGLVFELPDEPRKFAPGSPAKAFETYLLHLESETHTRVASLTESRQAVSLLEEAYKKKRSNVSPQREEVWIVRGRSEILEKIKEMMSRAQKRVTLVTMEGGFVLFYKTVGRLLDKIVDSGVKVWIGTSINSHNRHLARELNYVCKVRNISVHSPLLYLCIDDREFLLADIKPDGLNSEPEEDFGVISRNPYLCRLVSLLTPSHIAEVLPCKDGRAHTTSRARLPKPQAELGAKIHNF